MLFLEPQHTRYQIRNTKYEKHYTVILSPTTQYAIVKMNEEQILEELLALLEANGVAIRSEPLSGSGGGLCTIKGKSTFFVDTQAPSAEVAVLSAEAVSKLVDIEKLYIKPQVRWFIENHRGRIG